MTTKTYPYLSVQDHNEAWEFYVTVKPNRRVYLQSISQAKLAKIKKKTASNIYTKRVEGLMNGFGCQSKAELARQFYSSVFGRNSILKSRLP